MCIIVAPECGNRAPAKPVSRGTLPDLGLVSIMPARTPEAGVMALFALLCSGSVMSDTAVRAAYQDYHSIPIWYRI